ncbi:hypothetical protein GTQ34_09580 [Muricauda sp. JGD-17]|uniref:DUF1579 domain-containing protein n=1 Tax=Flagellimonas ochracea TaxID=2696472 RepID=A0A964WXL1_9FLAO|nr:hypothetical protein [Allomuricauda ochracea]NAY92170.1 hypothetical protein [Allomuricauda ochracea]
MKKIITFLLFVSILVCACNQPVKSIEVTKSEVKKEFGILNKNAPIETQQYGRLVGEWDCLITNYQNDTTASQSRASWVFKYALEGYAIQDYWKNPSNLDSVNQRQIIGTNIRIFNPRLDLWQCAWMENQAGSIAGVWVSHVNEKDEILLYDESKQWQITFYNISEDAFDWKWEVRRPDGGMQLSTTITANKRKTL